MVIFWTVPELETDSVRIACVSLYKYPNLQFILAFHIQEKVVLRQMVSYRSRRVLVCGSGRLSRDPVPMNSLLQWLFFFQSPASSVDSQERGPV